MYYLIIGLFIGFGVFLSTLVFDETEGKIQIIIYRILSFLLMIIALIGIVIKS